MSAKYTFSTRIVVLINCSHYLVCRVYIVVGNPFNVIFCHDLHKYIIMLCVIHVANKVLLLSITIK